MEHNLEYIIHLVKQRGTKWEYIPDSRAKIEK